MAKLRRDARTLKGKALSSLRRALECFNSFDDDGRVTTTLLHLQHASEMLLKAVLVQHQQPVFDRKQGVAIGFDRAVGLCSAHCGLTASEAGTLRAVDSLRDAAQHWLVFVDEEILYLHARALVTIFDDVLKRSLDTELLLHLPGRILPISTMVPQGFDLLIDRQYQQIHNCWLRVAAPVMRLVAAYVRFWPWKHMLRIRFPFPRKISIAWKRQFEAVKR